MKRTYCVTGLSRLTGRREAITPPCSLQKARRALDAAKMMEGDGCAYTRCKVERWGPVQQELDFLNNMIKKN